MSTTSNLPSVQLPTSTTSDVRSFIWTMTEEWQLLPATVFNKELEYAITDGVHVTYTTLYTIPHN